MSRTGFSMSASSTVCDTATENFTLLQEALSLLQRQVMETCASVCCLTYSNCRLGRLVDVLK